LSPADPADPFESEPVASTPSPLRVLLWMPNEGRIPGGHIVQLEKTAAALAEAGHDVATDFSVDPAPAAFDLVHGFALNAGHIRHWHRRGIPVALSSIYWERAYRVGGGNQRSSARSLAGRGLRAARFARAALAGRNSLTEACMTFDQRETELFASFESADLLLPNARGEGESIRRDLGVSTPIVPIPNGVDPARFSRSGEPFGQRAFVLYVGRIEPHKNQLGLIEALRGSGLPLVIAGHPHPDHPRYMQQCRSAGSGWVTFHVSLDETELAELYGRARVHVLPSWFETTGLVSLEAALSGCSIVSTSRGHAHEYLDRFAAYCDPAEPDSIRSAVRLAWETPPSPELRHRILDRYTWTHVAQATLAAYATLPERPGDRRR
jgi:glycosyltransferase involved in cell wall biosynthesis